MNSEANLKGTTTTNNKGRRLVIDSAWKLLYTPSYFGLFIFHFNNSSSDLIVTLTPYFST
jgi:hypothetical protein